MLNWFVSYWKKKSCLSSTPKATEIFWSSFPNPSWGTYNLMHPLVKAPQYLEESKCCLCVFFFLSTWSEMPQFGQFSEENMVPTISKHFIYDFHESSEIHCWVPSFHNTQVSQSMVVFLSLQLSRLVTHIFISIL